MVSAAYRAGHEVTMAEILSNPVLCHMAAAVKMVTTVIGRLDELKQSLLALTEDRDVLFRVVREAARYIL